MTDKKQVPGLTNLAFNPRWPNLKIRVEASGTRERGWELWFEGCEEPFLSGGFMEYEAKYLAHVLTEFPTLKSDLAAKTEECKRFRAAAYGLIMAFGDNYRAERDFSPNELLYISKLREALEAKP